MQELYSNNADFKRYVDYYCKNYSEGRSITPEEAFTHELIKQVAEEYRKENHGQLNIR